jgi:hypothetical protein
MIFCQAQHLTTQDYSCNSQNTGPLKLVSPKATGACQAPVCTWSCDGLALGQDDQVLAYCAGTFGC